ncbi:MAG: hypothetical protein AB1921_19835 [Thermodesulfobacteriota bacterium]
MKKAYRVLRIVLPVLGVLLGLIKILGLGIEVKTFDSFGYASWFRPTVGAAQAFFGLLIALPLTEVAGILLSISLLVMMAVLMATHGLPGLAAVPCAGIATLCFFAWTRRASRQ